ncbi:kinesin-like protein [Coemansia sp. 'formosensis']|nr:kinesin-like protein [Coemansia sp. 'formosensis']
MSTKMNFGPEWMRSAPASNRLSVSGGEGGAPGAGSSDRLADPDGKYAVGDSAHSGGSNRRYTQERMLELFKTQDIADTFAGSEHVFSHQPLAPVSLTELTSKEYELLSGSVNSSASKRYSTTQLQQQQSLPSGRSQQHHQQQPSHAYARNGGAHRASSNGLSNNAWAKLRDPLSRGGGPGITNGGADYDSLADLTSSSSNAPSGLDQLAGEESNSAWLRQPIVRDNVGSFGSDGVFRMGDDDGSGGGDLLEAPSSRDSMLVGARTSTSNYSAPGSAAGASTRHGMRPLHGRQAPGALSYADDDGGAWRDLSSAPPTPAAATGQQHRLLELAEQVKWWYRDPQGSVQGPFSASHMQEWLAGGYFPSDLQVCYEGGSSFEPLGTMVTRLGGPQNVFICAALAFLAQAHPSLSGISTPATPNAMSRTASTVQLRSPGGDIARSATGTPAARGSVYQLAPGSSAGTGAAAASSTTAQTSAYGQPAATSATQISTLLSDQLLIVSAIGERQYLITQYQEQHQQRLAKLMQDLSQEVNAVHYRAQMDRAPVQNEYLVTLQLRAQAAEERLRHDHMQLIQNQAVEIGRLEASIDPVIKEMVVRNGTEFAINFINQQLQELSLMAATENAAPQTSVAVSSAEPAAVQPTDAGSDQPISNEDAVVRKDPAASEPEISAVDYAKATTVAQTDVAALADDLECVEIATSDKPAATSAVPAKKDVSKSASGKSPAATQPATVAGAKSGKNRSQSKVSDTGAAKPASPWDTSKSVSKSDAATVATAAPTTTTVFTPAGTSESGSRKASFSANVATPAPWSNSTAAAKGKQPKKSLLQIQQEEEEALRKRQQADEQQRVSTVATRGFGPTYADRLGSAASVAPRSLAAIMAEQSKESSRNSSSVSIADAHPAADDFNSNTASGWTVARVISSQSAPAPPAAPASGPAWGGASASGTATNGDLSNLLGAKPAAGRPTAAKPSVAAISSSSSAGPTLPSIAFLEWCQSRLSSLRGIDVYKFIEMLLTFPLKAPESTLEIITEQVYAYSTTLNGRAFAEDFVARRAKDHAAVRNGSAKSAPANWAFVLEASKSAASGSAASSGNGFSTSANSAHAMSRTRGASSAGSSFQVVGKKGKK